MGLKTPLFDWHQAHVDPKHGVLADFAGWDMPVVYSSIVEEHLATRRGVGLFDISHMGRLHLSGPDACRFLDRVLSNRVDNLKLGQVRYALMLNDQGMILDDVLVYRFTDWYMLVVNASNREKLLPWLEKQRVGYDVVITDNTFAWGMIACQGPRALELVQPLIDIRLGELQYYFAEERHQGADWIVASRTGYTGEDGCELIVPTARVRSLWDTLLDTGTSLGARAVGLGARDTLRLEAGMPLYGHELSEDLDPLQAGLRWAVKSENRDFVGKAALAAINPGRPVRVGLKLADKRIARQGFPIVHGDRTVGSVTSGTFAPTLQQSVAMGYVEPDLAAIGTELAILIRERPVSATVVSLPFYQREKKHG